ncbi:hypothetical protein Gotri_008451 [Gossypium trilobum]|uniref:Uncharacterized protein n=1 Tax=Gossypium trilobum TaxID=34281 RepID=A0A7J9EJF4_9ROSI|nr:hypothetical protein [Gossypium trilobum]
MVSSLIMLVEVVMKSLLQLLFGLSLLILVII